MWGYYFGKIPKEGGGGWGDKFNNSLGYRFCSSVQEDVIVVKKSVVVNKSVFN